MCTNYAEALIIGGSRPCGFFRMCDASDMKDAATKAGFTCEPIDRYLEIAKVRVEARAERMRNMPPPPPYQPIAPPLPVYQAPRRTVCSTIGNQFVCQEM